MFDKVFRKAPFMRVLFPMTIGILLGRYDLVPPVFTWILAGSLFLLLLSIIVSDRLSGSLLPFLDRRDVLLAGIFQALFLCMGGMMGREDEVKRIPEGMLQLSLNHYSRSRFSWKLPRWMMNWMNMQTGMQR